MLRDGVLERCRRGDPLAWEAVVREFQVRVHGLALHYLKNCEDARDLTQEVFLRLYANLDACQDQPMLLPWLIRVTRNAAIDHLRRQKARPPARDILAEDLLDLARSDKTPAEGWELESRRRILGHCLSGMTRLNRQVIEMKDLQELPLDEIARRLGVPLGTIKSRCHRARQELESRLLELMGDSPRKLCELEESL